MMAMDDAVRTAAQSDIPHGASSALTVDDHNDLEQICDIMQARGYLYLLFHKMFSGTPNDELLACLFGASTQEVLSLYADDDVTLCGLASFLDTMRKRNLEDILSDACDEFTRIFIGPGSIPASPYESPYTGEHDMCLFQENTLTVRRCYHREGLRLKRELAIPDDHIAAMCDFMAILARRSLDTLGDGKWPRAAMSLRSQRVFLDNHVFDWVGIYAKAVRTSSAGEHAVIYPQLLEAFSAFVAIDGIFANEAAYWLEQKSALGVSPDVSAGTGLTSDVVARRRMCMQQGYSALKSIDVFGAQDVELVAID
jgi:TorA maturation chaperone TorD